MMYADRVSSPDRLAYWYFRLNGFLTTENFVIHPDSGRNQRTDADLLAVRFRHRAELLREPMHDDHRVAECSELVNVIVAEVKKGRCALNGPWTERQSENMLRLVRAVGCIPPGDEEDAVTALYGVGSWTGTEVRIRLFAVGEWPSFDLPIPRAQQILWDEVVSFCIDRFGAYRNAKQSVAQWDDDGRAFA